MINYTDLYYAAYAIFSDWLDLDYAREYAVIKYMSNKYDYYDREWDNILMQLTDVGHDRDYIENDNKAIQTIQDAAKDLLENKDFEKYS